MGQTVQKQLLRDELSQDDALQDETLRDDAVRVDRLREEALRTDRSRDDRRREDMLRDLERELHDLCQPLTTLQCRMELGQIAGDKDSLREAVDGSLGDMANVFRGIAEMRERLAEYREGQA